MNRISFYLVAALAATTTLNQARADFFIDTGAVADMNDQQCRQYVKERYLEDAKKDKDERSEKIQRDLEKLKRAIAAIKKLRKSTDAIAEGFRKAETAAEKKAFWVAFVGWAQFAGASLATAVAYVESAAVELIATGAIGGAIPMIDSLKARYEEVGRIGGELGKKMFIANRQLKRTYEAIAAINDWGVKARDRLQEEIRAHHQKIKAAPNRAEAAVNRHCGEGQSVQTFSASEMGLEASYNRTTPIFSYNPKPNRPSFRPAGPTDRWVPSFNSDPGFKGFSIECSYYRRCNGQPQTNRTPAPNQGSYGPGRKKKDSRGARPNCPAGKVWNTRAGRCLGYAQ